MTAYILHESGFDQAGVTITTDHTDATDHPFGNAYDHRLHTTNKLASGTYFAYLIDAGAGNTITADALGVAGHNIFASGGARPQLYYSDVGGTNLGDYTLLAATQPASGDDKVFFGRSITGSQTKRYWLVLIAGCDTTTYIGHVSFGEALQCQPIGQGFQPTIYQHYSAINSTNRQGNYIGNIVKKTPQDLRIRQRGIDPADFRTDWVPFLEHAATKPFFFCWDFDNYPEEAVFCWSDKPQLPSYHSLCLMGVDLRCKAVYE